METYLQLNYDIWFIILNILYYQNDYQTILNLRHIIYNFVTDFFQTKLPYMCTNMTNFGQNLHCYFKMTNNILFAKNINILHSNQKLNESYIFISEDTRKYISHSLPNSSEFQIYIRCRKLANADNPVFVSESPIISYFSPSTFVSDDNIFAKYIAPCISLPIHKTRIYIVYDIKNKNRIWMITNGSSSVRQKFSSEALPTSEVLPTNEVLPTRIISFITSKQLSSNERKLICGLMNIKEKSALIFWISDSQHPYCTLLSPSAEDEPHDMQYIGLDNIRICATVDKIAGIISTENTINNLRMEYMNWLDIITQEDCVATTHYIQYKTMTNNNISSFIGSLFDTQKFPLPLIRILPNSSL